MNVSDKLAKGHCLLVLDVAEADLTAFAPLRARLAEQGVAFATLAEEQEQQADWLARFTDLDNETRLGDIGTPRTMEQMPERLAFLGVDPEALFLAKADDLYIGYSLLNQDEENPDRLRQGWTGVRPAYRRQGIATALKALGIAYARAHGYRQIVTEPRTANEASVAMSAKVGFRAL